MRYVVREISREEVNLLIAIGGKRTDAWFQAGTHWVPNPAISTFPNPGLFYEPPDDDRVKFYLLSEEPVQL